MNPSDSLLFQREWDEKDLKSLLLRDNKALVPDRFSRNLPWESSKWPNEISIPRKKQVSAKKMIKLGPLGDFIPGIYHPPAKKGCKGITHDLDKIGKGTLQYFRCRDCKRPFCRKGDRNNHERRIGHERWRKGQAFQLDFSPSN